MKATTLDTRQFQAQLEENKPMLVEYWAPWCGYCRRIGPAYEQVAEEAGQTLTVSKINIDDEPALADREGIEVVPTLVLYEKGQAAGRLVAPTSKAKNGSNVTVAFDPHKIHLFDPETELTILN